MGCFDTVYFEKPHKCSKCNREITECQTKDLGECMASYVITKDDRFREGWKRYITDKKIAKNYNYISDIGFGCYDYCSIRTDDKCEMYHSFYVMVLDGKVIKIKHSETPPHKEA